MIELQALYLLGYILGHILDVVLTFESSIIICTMNDDSQRSKYHKRGRINRIKQAMHVHLCALDCNSHITAHEVGNVLMETKAENIVM